MENRVHDLGRRVHSVCLVLRCVQFRATTDVGQSGQGRGEGRETRLGNREDYRGDATLTLATSALVSCLSALLSPILSYHSCYSYFSRRFSFFVFRSSFLHRSRPFNATQFAVARLPSPCRFHVIVQLDLSIVERCARTEPRQKPGRKRRKKRTRVSTSRREKEKRKKGQSSKNRVCDSPTDGLPGRLILLPLLLVREEPHRVPYIRCLFFARVPRVKSHANICTASKSNRTSRFYINYTR